MKRNVSVMFVEDDESTQEAIKVVFQNEFKEFYQAFSAEEAIKIFKTHMPDIVVTDISLPGIDGLQMAMRLKQINEDVGIIVLSAFDDKRYFLKAINEVGVNFFILKPVDLNELLSKIDIIMYELEEKKKKKSISLIDPLTEIYNRRGLEEKIDSLKSRDFFALCITIDNFEEINHKFGHSIGDEVLKEFVKSIKAILDKDSFFGRVEGSEFLILFENKKENDIKDIISKIDKLSLLDIEGKKIKLDLKFILKFYKAYEIYGLEEIIEDMFSLKKAKRDKIIIVKGE